jgi:hypothetical protein
MEIGRGGEIMQIKLKIAFAAASFALATIPVLAGEMPTDGTKNFSTPNDAPSYFANETVPESARVASPASFTSEDVAAAPEDEPAVSGGRETGRHASHASAHSSAKHSLGRSRGYARSTRTAALHSTATHTNAGRAAAANGAGRGGTQAGASKPSTTRHARTGTGQHATAGPPVEPSRRSIS